MARKVKVFIKKRDWLENIVDAIFDTQTVLRKKDPSKKVATSTRRS